MDSNKKSDQLLAEHKSISNLFISIWTRAVWIRDSFSYLDINEKVICGGWRCRNILFDIQQLQRESEISDLKYTK